MGRPARFDQIFTAGGLKMGLRSIYTGTKDDGTLAIAIDKTAVRDEKILSKFVQLAIEAGMVLDRVEPYQVQFMLPSIHRDEPTTTHGQLKMQGFDMPAADESPRLGPADMGEGFTCDCSGECPSETKGCNTCDYAMINGQFINQPKAKAEEQPDQVADEQPVSAEAENEMPVTEEQAAADDGNIAMGELIEHQFENTPLMQWAGNQPPEGQPASDNPETHGSDVLDALNEAFAVEHTAEMDSLEEFGQKEEAEWEETHGDGVTQEEEVAAFDQALAEDQ
jgi:hypothetical protein